MIRVLVVDDHAIVRQGLSRLFATCDDVEMVGLAENGHDALHMVARLRPDVVVMDIAMPLLDGIGATRLIADHDPDVRIVVLTGSLDERIAHALDAGACGYLLKDAGVEEVLAAVRAAAADRGHAGRTVGGPRGAVTPLERLSPREREVLHLLAGGRSNRQIATELGISERTVKAHLSRVFQVVGAADRVQAALWGREFLAPSGS
jgi:DNA-binding NarL/FixJ family response regulator